MAIIVLQDVPKSKHKATCARYRGVGATSCKVIKDEGDTVDLEITFPDKEKHTKRQKRIS